MKQIRRGALLGLLAGAVVGVGAQGPGQAPGGPREGAYLYRFSMLQAAPGRLVDLIDALVKQAPLVAASGDELPFIVRHSQGDHWDLLVVYPMGSLAEFYGRDRVARRAAVAGTGGSDPTTLARQVRAMFSWQEDLFVAGPPVEAFRANVSGMGLLHFEMMQALPGRFDDLVQERRMENAFNEARGRGQTLIFTREQGAAWDVVTLGAYRNWRHYAESETIPPELAEQAARKAGFAGVDLVGPYMRTLISTHRDTLGPPVPAPGR
ncbi:MAG TPA: hypothetical protein VGK32_05260 [Vicinamibacterales bacterium]|jgi:hypothetical protein